MWLSQQFFETRVYKISKWLILIQNTWLNSNDTYIEGPFSGFIHFESLLKCIPMHYSLVLDALCGGVWWIEYGIGENFESFAWKVFVEFNFFSKDKRVFCVECKKRRERKRERGRGKRKKREKEREERVRRENLKSWSSTFRGNLKIFHYLGVTEFLTTLAKITIQLTLHQSIFQGTNKKSIHGEFFKCKFDRLVDK